MGTNIIFLFVAGLALCNGAALEEGAQASSLRIVDGNLAVPGQFPYAVSVQMLGDDNQAQNVRGHICGGALFTRSHVVTVASCLHVLVDNNFLKTAIRLYDHDRKQECISTNTNKAKIQAWADVTENVPSLLPGSALRVFAGSVVLTNDSSADLVRPVANITVHPQYIGPPSNVHDIAVVTLTMPFPEPVVTPLALPSASFNPPDFTTCTVTGWGGTNTTENSTVALRFATKYIYNQKLCMQIFNPVPNSQNILPAMVCAVSLDILQSNCIGDEGNALVCAGTFTGVLSRTDGCRSTSWPEVYTRISNHTAWLRSVSGSSAIYAPGVFAILGLISLAQMFFTM